MTYFVSTLKLAMSARCGRYTCGRIHERNGSDQSHVMTDTAGQKMNVYSVCQTGQSRKRRLAAAGFLGCAALVIDFNFDTPVFRAASVSFV
jgi:hypothetical protein